MKPIFSREGQLVVKRQSLKIKYKALIDRIKEYGYQLKINTVVHQLNYHESMSELIQYAQPERWKVFQVLPIKGENDEHIEDFMINEEMFNQFISNHHQFAENQMMITENNAEMKDSYVMVDFAGRFCTNKNGKQEYSFPILETGIKNAYDEMRCNYQNLINRRGLYQWNKNK